MEDKHKIKKIDSIASFIKFKDGGIHQIALNESDQFTIINLINQLHDGKIKVGEIDFSDTINWGDDDN